MLIVYFKATLYHSHCLFLNCFPFECLPRRFQLRNTQGTHFKFLLIKVAVSVAVLVAVRVCPDLKALIAC